MLPERVVAPRAPVLGADTPAGRAGGLPGHRVAASSSRRSRSCSATHPPGARTLGELVYDDPRPPAAPRRRVPVRERAREARGRPRGGRARPELAVNVTALTAYSRRTWAPTRSPPSSAPRGSAPRSTSSSCRAARRQVVTSSTAATTSGMSAATTRGTAATCEWGTSRMRRPRSSRRCLPERGDRLRHDRRRRRGPPRRQPVRPPRPRRRPRRSERFAEWCWEDQRARPAAAGHYNRLFNTIVLRDYSAEGERLTLPGLVEDVHADAPTSAPPSRGSCPSPPSACSTQSAPARRSTCHRRRASSSGSGWSASRDRGPEPHARAVHPRVAAALPARPGPRRLAATTWRATAPAVRRHESPPTTGTGSHDPLRVRAHPALAGHQTEYLRREVARIRRALAAARRTAAA